MITAMKVTEFLPGEMAAATYGATLWSDPGTGPSGTDIVAHLNEGELLLVIITVPPSGNLVSCESLVVTTRGALGWVMSGQMEKLQ